MSNLDDRTAQRSTAQRTHLARAQALLQIWLSPAFPVGAFAYSHGLEAAVDRGWIRDRSTLEPWLADLIEIGSLRNDLILLAAAWRSTRSEDPEQLQQVTELGAALQPTAERFLEATQQGRSFLLQLEAAWTPPVPMPLINEYENVTFSIAIGIAGGLHAIPLAETLRAYAVAFLTNLTSAAIRLSVIGPTEAQQILASLIPALLAISAAAETATLDDLGATVWRSDLGSMLHETQHTRLFRS